MSTPEEFCLRLVRTVRASQVLMTVLETVREQLPTTTAGEVDRARELVARGVERLGDDLASRAVDEAVVALRRRVESAVADELSRLPAGGQVSSEDAARALRRLAARLLHTPTVHARTAARPRSSSASRLRRASPTARPKGATPSAPPPAARPAKDGSRASAAAASRAMFTPSASNTSPARASAPSWCGSTGRPARSMRAASSQARA